MKELVYQVPKAIDADFDGDDVHGTYFKKQEVEKHEFAFLNIGLL